MHIRNTIMGGMKGQITLFSTGHILLIKVEVKFFG